MLVRHLFNQNIILENTHVKDMWVQHGIGIPRFITLCLTAPSKILFYFSKYKSEGRPFASKETTTRFVAIRALSRWPRTEPSVSPTWPVLPLGSDYGGAIASTNTLTLRQNNVTEVYGSHTFCETWGETCGGGKRLFLTWGSKRFFRCVVQMSGKVDRWRMWRKGHPS